MIEKEIFKSISTIEIMVMELISLGDGNGEFEVNSIANAITEWYEVKDEEGNVRLDESGFVLTDAFLEDDGSYFWTLAENFKF